MTRTGVITADPGLTCEFVATLAVHVIVRDGIVVIGPVNNCKVVPSNLPHGNPILQVESWPTTPMP